MNAVAAIQRAEFLLPGEPAPSGRRDPRWQAIVSVARFVRHEPEAVWEFVDEWGNHPQEDLREAVASCLVEPLLEFHFDDFFPLVEERTISDAFFADMFLRCTRFGQAAELRNAKRFDALQRQLAAKFFD